MIPVKHGTRLAAVDPAPPGPRRHLRWAAWTAGCWFGLLGAALLILYALPNLQLRSPTAVLLSSFIPLAALAWVAAIALLLLGGGRVGKVGAAAAAAGLLASLLPCAPYFRSAQGSDAAGLPGPRLRLLTVNTRCDGAGRVALAALIADSRPDLVIIQGANPNVRNHLRESGALQRLKYQVAVPYKTAPQCLTTLYSALPITATEASGGDGQLVVSVRARPDFVLLPVDLPSPQKGTRAWVQAFTKLQESALSARPAPLVLAGDFNAVREHAPLRRLAAAVPMHNAAELAGSGWSPTFRDGPGLPPLLEIDHVFVSSEFTVQSLQSVSIRGNAHRALLTSLRITVGPENRGGACRRDVVASPNRPLRVSDAR